jgi:hypothetical protein
MSDWFDNGREAILDALCDQSGLSRQQAGSALAFFCNIGLIDYDMEKELYFEWSGEDIED